MIAIAAPLKVTIPTTTKTVKIPLNLRFIGKRAP